MAQRISDLEAQLTSQMLELKEARSALDENARVLARKEEQLMVSLPHFCIVERRSSVNSLQRCLISHRFPEAGERHSLCNYFTSFLAFTGNSDLINNILPDANNQAK